MKKFILVLLMAAFSNVFSQSVPPVINYQGVARDANGDPVSGNISVRLFLSTTVNSGGSVYQETYVNIPTFNGLFSIKFGSSGGGIPNSLNWGGQDYYLVVEIDPAGGTSFSSMGSQHLVSVPMALYAERAGNAVNYTAGQNININGASISSSPSLSLSGDTLKISGGGSYVVMPSFAQTSVLASSNVTVTSPGTNTFNLTVPNYVAGSNVTITPAGGNDFSISAGGGTVSPNAFLVYSPHTSTTVGNSTTLNIISPNISITGGGGSVTTNVLPNYILNIPSVAITPTSGGLNVSQGPVNYTVPVSSGPWGSSGNDVFLLTNTNHVGIGTVTPASKLEVQTMAGSTVNAISAFSQGGTGVFALTNSTNSLNLAVHGVNNGQGNGILGVTFSSGTLAVGVKGVNMAAGSGISGENTSGSTSFNAHGVRGLTNSSSSTAAGVFGENQNAGPAIYGYQGSSGGSGNASGVMGVSNSSLAPGIQGINNVGQPGVYGIMPSAVSSPNAHGVKGETYSQNSGAAGVWGQSVGTGAGVYGQNYSNPSSPTANGVLGRCNNPNVSASGVRGENIFFNGGSGVTGMATSSVGYGVYGDNGLGIGVYGRSNSTNTLLSTAGVQGNHYGNGYGVIGLSGSGSPNYSGVFGSNSGGGSGVYGQATTNTNTMAAGVFGFNQGTGPAVRASLPAGTIGGSINTALLIENGHIKINGGAATAGTYTFAGFSGGSVSFAPAVSGNDVKGTVSFYTPNGFTGIAPGGYVEQEVVFSKNYTSAPTVVLTPLNDLQGLSFMVSGTSSTSFRIRVYRTANPNIPGPNITPQNYPLYFSYMVLE